MNQKHETYHIKYLNSIYSVTMYTIRMINEEDWFTIYFESEKIMVYVLWWQWHFHLVLFMSRTPCRNLPFLIPLAARSCRVLLPHPPLFCHRRTSSCLGPLVGLLLGFQVRGNERIIILSKVTLELEHSLMEPAVSDPWLNKSVWSSKVGWMPFA